MGPEWEDGEVTSQDTLQQRYGSPAPWRRRATWAVSVVVIVAALGWVVWAMTSHAEPPVDSEMIAFDVVDEHTATARVQVRVRADAEDVQCLLRAFADDHVTVGEHSFTAAPGDDTLVEQVRTERRATSIELVGCTAEGQPRPS